MLYCDRCQVLSEDGKTCPLCGGRRLRPAAAEDPVLLFTAGGEEAERIAAAFDDEGIPHMERIQDGGSASTVLLGRRRFAQTRIFAPFGEIDRARDVMRGIGALKDDGKDAPVLHDGSPAILPQKASTKEKGAPMSRGRATALRIFSIILFLILICAVVMGADAIVAGFKSMFQ